jgi:hypothetical protein
MEWDNHIIKILIICMYSSLDGVRMTYCHLVTLDRGWIGNRIYGTLTTRDFDLKIINIHSSVDSDIYPAVAWWRLPT